MIRVAQGGRAEAADVAAHRVYDLSWQVPAIGTSTIGGNASMAGIARFQSNGVMWVDNGAAPVYGLHKGSPAVRFPPAAGTGLFSDASFQLPLTRRGAGAIGAGAYFARVLFSIARSQTAGIEQRDTGLYFGVRAVGVVGLPTISGVTFGLMADGAGGWVFGATQAGTGVFTISQALAWPTAVDEWCDGEFRLYPATRDQEARVELWAAGTPLISRSWGVGTLLPDYSPIVNALGFALCARCRDMGAGTRDLLLAGVRIIQSTTEDLS